MEILLQQSLLMPRELHLYGRYLFHIHGSSLGGVPAVLLGVLSPDPSHVGFHLEQWFTTCGS